MAIYEMKDYMAKAREAVGEGIVLLRNEGAVLPLQKGSRAAVSLIITRAGPVREVWSTPVT